MDGSRKEKKYFGLSRNVFVFGFVSLLNDWSSEITVRILPLFLANVLGVKTSVIGLIEGVADSTATLLKMLSGWFSDKIGRRKPLVLAGYALSSLSKPLFYFANSWPFVLVLRFLDRVGKGVRTSPKDALIADSTESRHQGRAFGFSRAMDPLGAVLGLLTAAGLIALGGAAVKVMTRSAFRHLVLLSAVPALLGVFLVGAFIRDKEARPEKQTMPRLSFKGLDRRFRRFLGLMIIFTLGNSSDAFLILRSQQLGLSLVQILLMLAAFNLVTTLIAYPAGILSDRIGRSRVIIAGWLVYGLIYLGFAFANRAWQVWVLYTIYGAYYGATEGVGRALVADVVQASDKRGTAYGLYNAAIGVSALPASFLAGLLWQSLGPAAPFLFGAGLSLLAAGGMAIFVRERRA
ncbi:MAG: MFS transporter [Candidatus Aminicenantes bacterium]|nr:MFS transporter [Candidatus Aminicenantes bacterium]